MTREELYDLVWTVPVSKILDDHKITNASFKKICDDNDIPLPENGYWQKLRFNKKVTKIPLPSSGNHNLDISLVNDQKPLSKLQMIVREIKSDSSLPVRVPEKFNRTDKIIIRTKRYYGETEKKNKKKLEFPKGGIFFVNVSKPLRKRAYLFADTLIKLVRARGHDIKLIADNRRSYNNATKLVFFGEEYEVRIREPNIRVMKPHLKYDWKEAHYYPSGKLSLKLDDLHDYVWTDSKNKRLEEKLPNIIAYFELRAKEDIEERKRRDEWHKEYQRKKKIEEDLNNRRNKELKDFRELINQSSRWQKSKFLREYISAVEQNQLEKGELSEEFNVWIKWVKGKADWYDPFIEKEDELFKDIDRDSI